MFFHLRDHFKREESVCMCQYILYLYYYISIMAPKTENEPALEEQNVTEHQPRQVYTADYLT